MRKISCGLFSIFAALKPDFPKVAYVSTGGEANVGVVGGFYVCDGDGL